MRRATLCLLLILCSVIVFAQQPQWRTVASVALFNQTQAIPSTTLLTPSEPGIYRLNIYFSGGGGTAKFGTFTERLAATDITGYKLGDSGNFTVFCGMNRAWQWLPPVTISLKPNTPLNYEVDSYAVSPDCVYNVAITVEQLTQ
jgi:hypothetical protein